MAELDDQELDIVLKRLRLYDGYLFIIAFCLVHSYDGEEKQYLLENLKILQKLKEGL